MTTRFRIEAGIRCFVRRRGSTEWVPFTTTHRMFFVSHGEEHPAWTFERDGWVMLIDKRKVTTVIDASTDSGPHPLFSQKELTHKGRGRNRRRNAKLKKKWKGKK